MKLLLTESTHKFWNDFKTKIQEMHGSFNDFPVGWRKASDDAVLCELTRNTFVAVEMRQMWPKGPKTDLRNMLPATLFYKLDGTGFAFSTNWSHTDKKYITTCYLFGCDHDYYESKRVKMCLHEYTCKKCGHVEACDSSD